MSLVQYIFILTFFNHFFMHVINGESWSKSCNLVEEKSPYLRLKRHLLCDYDPSVRPTTNSHNRTDLSIVVVPKLMEFVSTFFFFYFKSLLIFNYVFFDLTNIL